ncbi:MAG TPA: hypothetical protein VIZ90_02965 [Rhizobiaceae bacterium]
MASGDPPNTARKPTGKKAVKLSQREQSERFKQAARELEADETGEAFEKAMKKVLPGRKSV